MEGFCETCVHSEVCMFRSKMDKIILGMKEFPEKHPIYKILGSVCRYYLMG